MKLLEIENLNLGFKLKNGFYEALKGISFDIEKGEMLAIVGESGSGKTISGLSIMNLLPKNARITSGKITFDGENILAMKKQAVQKLRGKRIAMIPQDPITSLNPLYTVENQLLEVIKEHRGLSGNEAKEIALKSLEKVKIPSAESRLKAYPYELSGGMCQRVIIAMALACRADLIIADEPTTALDVTVQAQIMELLSEIKTNFNTSIILITHDLGLVAEYADKVAVMYSGKIVEYSTSKTIFEFPKHPYTQALLASLPDLHTEKLGVIEGNVPTITENISGCAFHPRCKYVLNICSEKTPDLTETKTGSKSACWLGKDIVTD